MRRHWAFRSLTALPTTPLAAYRVPTGDVRGAIFAHWTEVARGFSVGLATVGQWVGVRLDWEGGLSRVGGDTLGTNDRQADQNESRLQNNIKVATLKIL